MENTLNILMLEDNEDDAEIIQHFLRRSMPGCQFKLATNREEFLDALCNYKAEVILSDNTLPRFNASEALAIFQQHALLIPFILVTGTVSEEFAAGIMKAGADDYLLKDRLTRLPSAIVNALEKKRVAAANREAAELIRFKADLLKSVGQALIATDTCGNIIYWNHVAETMYGWSAAATNGKNLDEILPVQLKPDAAAQRQRSLASGIGWSGELKVQHQDGAWFPAFVSDSPLRSAVGDLNGMIRVSYNIAAQKKAAADMLLMEKKLASQQIKEQKKISRAIIEGQEQERNYIGQELHDNINQILASAKMFMAMASKKNPEVKAVLEYPMELLNNSIEEIRNLTYRQVTPIKNVRLENLLQQLTDHVSMNTGVDLRLQFDAMANELSDELKLNLYRIVQEQVNNIVKHANATFVSIQLQQLHNHVQLEVTDDGRGFDTNAQHHGIGITNMSNRIASYNGQMELVSSPGNGCVLKVMMPIDGDE